MFAKQTPSRSSYSAPMPETRLPSHSDVDLLVIAPSDLPRFKRSRALYKSLRPYPFGMDLLVYTPDEIEKGQQSPLSFISHALREGKTVYVCRD